jgi:hypothetical protein
MFKFNTVIKKHLKFRELYQLILVTRPIVGVQVVKGRTIS